jgi:hypothetical protein
VRKLNSIRSLFSWLREVALDPVGGLGILLATFGGGLFVVLVGLSLAGFPFNHYVGIFIYLVLPMILLTGLVLIPIGRWRIARRYPGGRMPQFDFENPRHLRAFGVFLLMSAANICLFGIASYGAYHLSDSNEFCGLVCHTVMEPEWTAHQLSPHSRVGCVECHIGPGAGWFVRSKLSGVRQVLAVAAGTYTRPIETPVHNLRPARETCEQCHWPEKFHGDKLQTITHFDNDEESTELVTALLLRVGGGTVNRKPAGGIHWHTNPANRVTYVSTDDSREEIPWIRLETEDGEVEDFVADGFEGTEELLQARPPRTMDCVDCHNRPTHVFESPEEAVDRLLQEDRLSREIPFVRREAVRALRAVENPGDDPAAAIREALEKAYEKYADRGIEIAPSDLTAVSEEVGVIWSRNVFPAMQVSWGTYPSFLGHEDDGGCFRCHDGMHTSSSGRTISDDCETCHVILAEEEENPVILSEIYDGTR